ncbi:MAG: hypothetical protein SPL39_06610 [Selenomonadaceae bacterium]|nr:hypothetical protein [Selenomonadaceae bacterium]
MKGWMVMIEDVQSAWQQGKEAFAANVKDTFGQAILNEGYEPLGQELSAVRAAMDAAHQEQAMVRNVLQMAKAIVV